MKNSWTGGEAACSVDGLEENLAVAVHRKEPGAFERLIERFERSLFNYAHGILQNTFDAQEVVQDAMMRAHRALTNANVPIFENLAGLAALPPRGAVFIGLPMKIRGGSGGPLRAVAVLP